MAINRETHKQVTISLPRTICDAAEKEANRKRVREDGLKLLPTAVLRRWLLKGWEAERSGN